MKNEAIGDGDILSLLNPNGNDKISDLKGIDLSDFLHGLYECDLEYRKNLDIDEDLTFGLEVEFEALDEDDYYNDSLRNVRSEIYNETELSRWNVTIDDSLDSGGEVDSPILIDSVEDWESLELVCSIVEKYGEATEHCGGHIHVGTQCIGNNKSTWLKFLKLWSVYENIIYRFTNGITVYPRYDIKEYANPVSDDFRKAYNIIDKINSDYISLEKIRKIAFRIGRYSAVNLTNIVSLTNMKPYNTIEFRSPNGSLEPVIWQNNTMLFANILRACKESDFDDDTVERRKRVIDTMPLFYSDYSKLSLKQAIEFSDIVFNKNLDKLYFLRQYLKNKEAEKKQEYVSKSFIKKK